MKLGVQARIFLLALAVMVIPPLWIGIQAGSRELQRVEEGLRVERIHSVEEAANRLSAVFNRTLKDLEVLASQQAAQDHQAFRELDLEEEAAQHLESLRSAAAELRNREPCYRSVTYFGVDGDVRFHDGPAVARSLAAFGLASREGQQRRRPGQAVHWFGPRRIEDQIAFGVSIQVLDRWEVPIGIFTILLDAGCLAESLGYRTSRGWLTAVGPDTATLVIPPGGATPRWVPVSEVHTTAPALAGVLGEGPFSGPSTVQLDDDAVFEVFPSEVSEDGWQLALLEPREDLYGAVHRIRNQTLGQVLLGFLAASLMAAWLARRLGSRILQLAEAAQALGEGRSDVDLDDPTDDEIGRLARAFSRMRDRVNLSQELLHERIEELESARDQLIQAEKLSVIGTLASGIAHEIHSPLMTIGAQAGTLRLHAGKDTLDPEKLQRLSSAISREVEGASRIIRSLQDYSRMSRGDTPLEVLELRPVIERSLDLLQARKDSSRISFRTEPCPRVRGDANRLAQVFVNLFQNALDADPSGRAVEVALSGGHFTPADLATTTDTRPPVGSPFAVAEHLPEVEVGQPAAVVTVDDAGCGIPEEHLPHLFAPFFTTKPSGEGTGLGLAIVQGILWVHQGSLRFETRSGGGTRAILKLPADRRPTDA